MASAVPSAFTDGRQATLFGGAQAAFTTGLTTVAGCGAAIFLGPAVLAFSTLRQAAGAVTPSGG